MASTSTTFVTSLLNSLEGKMGDIASAIEGLGRNVGADVTAAEDIASATVGVLAASGNAAAVTAEAFLPFAEGLIASAEKAFGVSAAPAAASTTKPASS